MSRLRDELSEMTGRNTTWLEVDEQIGRINHKLRGWSNYFCIGTLRQAYKSVTEHVRHRVRQWLSAEYRVSGRGKTRFTNATSTGSSGSTVSRERSAGRFVSDRVNRLVRKLDAGKPPVQFDERGVETDQAHRPCWSETTTLVYF